MCITFAPNGQENPSRIGSANISAHQTCRCNNTSKCTVKKKKTHPSLNEEKRRHKFVYAILRLIHVNTMIVKKKKVQQNVQTLFDALLSILFFILVVFFI